MSITFSSPPPRPGVDARTVPHAAPAAGPAPTGGRRWPLFGVVGAVTGLAASILSIPQLDEEDYSAGPEVIQQLEATNYRIAFVLGLISVGCLLVAAAGWRRWAEARAPRSLAARLVGQGLAVTATVNVIFSCIAGSMGLYLEGGAEAATGPNDQGLYVNHIILDFGSLLGWWGAAASAIAVAALAFRSPRLLPRWMGVVSVLLLLPPVLMALATSLPGFVGLTMPIWLLAVSIGMVVSRTADAAA
ncbi:hypothetical protein HC251_05515 [Iamia sp. SCSIO 61187]|uniref:hypothetical protein n=1 Tax=Iamia sp. SCSIO 61187 TaxID=2722752 RepID=UPI001C638C56|nr:hypothetical protein [Iamia sp. SCSIO 61187]QYG91949.1 hypothetical protein HC251_05515 [Iamia sp. SCSIO 61187]